MAVRTGHGGQDPAEHRRSAATRQPLPRPAAGIEEIRLRYHSPGDRSSADRERGVEEDDPVGIQTGDAEALLLVRIRAQLRVGEAGDGAGDGLSVAVPQPAREPLVLEAAVAVQLPRLSSAQKLSFLFHLILSPISPP